MFIFDIYTKQKIALVSSEIRWKLFKSAQFDRYEPEYALGIRDVLLNILGRIR